MCEKIDEKSFFALWWRVVDGENGGGYSELVESGGDSPFFVEKSLENQAFSVKNFFEKWAFWGCFFVLSVLQCG
ncbi:MAG: hypothetical protein IKI92_03910 [Anaerotignum sp.]|nr:hypothetical protein [Anaerotignum sp.]